MSTVRWDPLGDLVTLREAMNNLLEESFARPRGNGEVAASGLAVDVRELPDRYVIMASVPGVDPDDVEISTLGEALEIRGRRRETSEIDGDGGTWLVRERRFGTFARTVALPGLIRAEGAEANFQHGVLTVVLPKAERATIRTIPVRRGGAPAPDAIDIAAQTPRFSDHRESVRSNA